jgi:hypothetical protein
MYVDQAATSLVFQAPLRRVRRGLGVGFTRMVQPTSPPSDEPSLPIPLARTLAFAHRLQRALDQGEVSSFDALAVRLGVSKARLSMVLALLNLAPDIQEEILFQEGKIENTLRPAPMLIIAREMSWIEQRKLWLNLRMKKDLHPTF